MKFRIVTRKEGEPDKERIAEAPSRFELYEQIEKEGGTVMSIENVKDSFAIPSWIKNGFTREIKRSVIAQMVKNLSTMLTAGLSLPRALSVIERESSNPRLKTIAARLSAIVGKGDPFHAALTEYPKVFPYMLVAMVKVGEESGSLANSLNIVGIQMEHSDELTRKVKGALIYPSIIVLAIIIVSVLMLIYVVPTLTKTFTELKVDLPLATKIFVGVSDFMVAHALFVVAALILFVVGSIAFTRSQKGSAIILRAGLRMPVVGELIRETYAARTARTLSSLLSAGVSVLEALSIAKDVVRVDVFADIIDEAMTRVKKGEPLSASFAEHPTVYPILMSEMIVVGEETGKVSEMLKQVAEFYETNVSEKTKDLSTVIEPVLMLLIGAVVGIFAVAMIAPIYSISSAI